MSRCSMPLGASWQASVVIGCVLLVARTAGAQNQPAPPPPPSQPAPSEPAPPPSQSAPATEPSHAEPKPGEYEPSEDEAKENLAQQLTNPIADLASVPFQFNWNIGVGPNDATQMVLNFQPVVPVHLTKSWNLIGRYIIPLVGQPSLGTQPAEWGMGDIEFSLFASPSGPSKIVWGVGPIVGLPGGSDPTINSGKWLLGPTGVGLYLDKPWTIGLLVNQVWSIAETSDMNQPGVSQMFVQPFVSYVKRTWTVTAESETTINWKASGDNRWSVPLELELAKLTKIGFLPFSAQVGAGWFAASPDNGPEWRFRLNFVILLPDPKILKAGLMKK